MQDVELLERERQLEQARRKDSFFELNLNGVVSVFFSFFLAIHGIGYGIWSFGLSRYMLMGEVTDWDTCYLWSMAKSLQTYSLISFCCGLFDSISVVLWFSGWITSCCGRRCENSGMKDCGLACRCTSFVPVFLRFFLWFLGAAFFVYLNMLFWPRCYYTRAADSYYYYLTTWGYYGITTYFVTLCMPCTYLICTTFYSILMSRFIERRVIYFL